MSTRHPVDDFDASWFTHRYSPPPAPVLAPIPLPFAAPDYDFGYGNGQQYNVHAPYGQAHSSFHSYPFSQSSLSFDSESERELTTDDLRNILQSTTNLQMVPSPINPFTKKEMKASDSMPITGSTSTATKRKWVDEAAETSTVKTEDKEYDVSFGGDTPTYFSVLTPSGTPEPTSKRKRIQAPPLFAPEKPFKCASCNKEFKNLNDHYLSMPPTSECAQGFFYIKRSESEDAHAFDIFSLNKPAQPEQIPEEDDDDDLFGDVLFGDDLDERDEPGDVRTQSPGIESASTAQDTDGHTQSSLSNILVLASPSESTSFLPPPELCMPTSLPPLQEGYNFSNFTSAFLPPKYPATMAPAPVQQTYMNPKPRRPKLGQSTAPSVQPVDDTFKFEYSVRGSGSHKNAQVAASGAENIRWAPAPVRRKSTKKRVAKKA
ncbi:hypothetical protein C8F01DRAFT_1361387 [Mycena amicta]|nr:hypothetical protein C8F01DRAFT_1361387 [Mycena amicta]